MTPPSIAGDAMTASGMRYRCGPGSWKGLSTNPDFEYEWFQMRDYSGPVLRPYHPVGRGPTYVLPSMTTADIVGMWDHARAGTSSHWIS